MVGEYEKEKKISVYFPLYYCIFLQQYNEEEWGIETKNQTKFPHSKLKSEGVIGEVSYLSPSGGWGILNY